MHLMRDLALLVVLSLVAGVLVAGIALPAVGGAGLLGKVGADNFEQLPSDLATPPLPQRSRILAKNGDEIASFYNEYRVNVPLKKVAPVMRKALIAIEDYRFYNHGSIDFKGTMRAFLQNQTSGSTQGGSTLTQQYVKLVQVEQADSPKEIREVTNRSGAAGYGRKLQELRYAVTMEKKYSKDEILERYLNIVYFGDGAYGVQAAAQHFFSKDASELTLPESAMLAGLVRSPYAYDPTKHPDTAKTRRNTVLQRMADTHAVSQADADKAKKAPLDLDVTNFPNSCNQAGGKLGFFCQYVVESVKQNPAFGDTPQERLNLLLNGGLTIKTTLSMKKQKAAQKAMHNGVRKWSRIVGSMAMVQPGSGKIRAMALSRDFTTERDAEKKELNVNTAVDAAHGGGNGIQFGSNAKAFTLAAALDAGYPLSTTINAPGSISGLSGFKSCDGTYSSYPHVANAAGESEHGSFNLVSGTVKSVNTFFVLLEHKVGLCKTWKMTKKLGMVQSANGKPLGQYPSLTLGADNVDPLHVAAAYAAFAARGKYCEPTPFEAVYDVHGNKIKGIHPDCRRALSKGAADSVAYAMKGVLTHGTAAGTNIGRPAAGKTGTSNNGATGYFTGYTPRLSASIALASPVSTSKYPLRGSELTPGHYAAGFGADGAPIWEDAMRGALDGKNARDFHSPPSQLVHSASLEVSVPNVVGLSVGDATSKLTGAGFNPVKGETVDSDEPAGTVVSTNPTAGAQTSPGSTVTLSVSGGSGSGSGGGGGGHGDNGGNGGGGHGNGDGNGNGHGNGNGRGHGPKHTGPPPRHNN